MNVFNSSLIIHNSSLLRGNADIPQRHLPMVALEHQWPLGHFLAREAARRDLVALDVLVDHGAIEGDLHELGVRHLFAALELRGLEVDDERLPFAKWFVDINLRR